MARSARIANTSPPSPIPCRRVRIWAPRWPARATTTRPSRNTTALSQEPGQPCPPAECGSRLLQNGPPLAEAAARFEQGRLSALSQSSRSPSSSPVVITTAKDKEAVTLLGSLESKPASAL